MEKNFIVSISFASLSLFCLILKESEGICCLEKNPTWSYVRTVPRGSLLGRNSGRPNTPTVVEVVESLHSKFGTRHSRKKRSQPYLPSPKCNGVGCNIFCCHCQRCNVEERRRNGIINCLGDVRTRNKRYVFKH